MSREPSESVTAYLLNGSDYEMNVDGSGTPVEYSYSVPERSHFTLFRVFFYIDDNTAFSADGFGALNALTNGVSVEVGGYELVNWKDNIDIVTTVFDYVGYPNLGKTTTSGAGRWTMGKGFGRPLPVRGGESIVVRISDDLRGLTHFRFRIQGVLSVRTVV